MRQFVREIAGCAVSTVVHSSAHQFLITNAPGTDTKPHAVPTCHLFFGHFQYIRANLSNTQLQKLLFQIGVNRLAFAFTTEAAGFKFRRIGAEFLQIFQVKGCDDCLFQHVIFAQQIGGFFFHAGSFQFDGEHDIPECKVLQKILKYNDFIRQAVFGDIQLLQLG